MTSHAPTEQNATTDASLDAIRAVFDDGEPMLTEEIEERFDLRHRTAVDRLEQLHERGVLDRKRIGRDHVVWWMPVASIDSEPEATEEVVVVAARSD